MTPLTTVHNPSLNCTSRVKLPVDCLEELIRKNDEPPFLFELESKDKHLWVGVHDFDAPPGEIHLGGWMLDHLEHASEVTVTVKTLPKGKSVKVQPQSINFLKISDVEQALSQSFQDYPVLTKGTFIPIENEGEVHNILIEDTSPEGAIYIVDTDLDVEFSAKKLDITPYQVQRSGPFKVFTGVGTDLKGKTKEEKSSNLTALRLPPGMLFFGYKTKPYKHV